MKERTRHLLDVLESWPWSTTREIAEELHLRPSTVRASLLLLVKRGLVGRRYCWREVECYPQGWHWSKSAKRLYRRRCCEWVAIKTIRS